LSNALSSHHVTKSYSTEISQLRDEWTKEVDRIYSRRHGPPLSQGEVIGLLNSALGPRDVIVCAAGSLPGDLHKLWRTRDPKGYHLEYGYSCMGYEIAGGLGVKMADPSRDVYVLVGDGSYLMMAQEIVTSLQENVKLNVVLFDNHGFSSIGGLSRACGSGGFGTRYEYRDHGSAGQVIPVDFVANAASLGAHSVRAQNREQLSEALAAGKKQPRTSVVVVETDYYDGVPGYESWWDVPIAEVSESESVQQARRSYVEGKKKERYFWPPNR
jgi:3D-(3,5/4)-trihydroxycyclohexane-1,2-dione acylhydrolase (decyclizing)